MCPAVCVSDAQEHIIKLKPRAGKSIKHVSLIPFSRILFGKDWTSMENAVIDWLIDY